jgi:proline iminopeptidase
VSLLDVGDGQQVWWTELGTPDGIPVVHLHGGPGGGTIPAMAAPYDLDRFRLVMLDQRGCGQSLPHASDPDVSLATNTTDHLVRDLELLREHLGIDGWIVSGSSWGTTLGLAYACAHPDRVRAMLLRGVTTYSRQELDWVYRDGARRLLPEAWEKFARIIDDPEADLVVAYRAALEDDETRTSAALAWCRWELDGMLAEPGSEIEAIFTDPRFAVCFARISTHYAAHHGFVDQTRLWETVPTFDHIPATIVQGRFDLCTPPATAWRLHRAWPGSVLHVLDDQDHRLAGATDVVKECLDALSARTEAS